MLRYFDINKYYKAKASVDVLKWFYGSKTNR
jgi:hypothetical protein